MRVGFTGTQRGMSGHQLGDLRRILRCFHGPVLTRKSLGGILHHGDCIGADEQANDIAREFSYGVEIHPPSDAKKRAWCTSIMVHAPKPYLERNHDIVDACDLLIACPAGPEVMRSGTWATIRYARKTGVPVIVLLEGRFGKEESDE